MSLTMSGDLFTVVDLDDPDSVESSATALKSATVAVEQTMGEAVRTWGGLESSYRAPETGELLQTLDPAAGHAAELARAGDAAESAVHSYAADLRDLRTQRRTLLADIEDFQATGVEGAAEDDWQARELHIEQLQRRCRALAEAKDAAQNRCATALSAISTSVSVARGSEHEVPEAAAADDVATSEQSAGEWARQAAGMTPGSTFGAPAVDAASFGLQKGLTVVGTTADAIAKGSSTMRPRQGWAPSKLRDVASMGDRSRRAVAAVTGWDASTVANGGRFLGADDARNPFRRVSGVKETAGALRSRFFASLSEQNRVAKSGQAGRFSTASKVARNAGRGGTALTAVTGAVGQWQEDSEAHPDMGWEEQGTRAATVGLSSAAGGWAGAKTGAAAGAAIGSFIPGVGTAVGAVAGGVIGGIAGSALGKEIGETVKDGFGDAADAVADGAKDAWDSVTSLF